MGQEDPGERNREGPGLKIPWHIQRTQNRKEASRAGGRGLGEFLEMSLEGTQARCLEATVRMVSWECAGGEAFH